jgi:hypothetical protein
MELAEQEQARRALPAPGLVVGPVKLLTER